jgi:hypothetical protein
MIALFAHHVEPQHYPVLAALFAAGFWLGWQLLSRRAVRPPDHGDVKNTRTDQ